MPSWWTMVWFMVDHLVNYPLEESYYQKKYKKEVVFM